MKNSDSVSAYYLLPIIHSLGSEAEQHSVLAKLGIDPTCLEKPDVRISAKTFTELWLNQIHERNDEFFGLDSHGMPPGAFALISRALIQEPNLHTALIKCLEYFAIFLRDFKGSLSIHDDLAVILVNSTALDDQYGGLGEETFLILIISMLCWLGGCRIPVSRASFRYKRMRLDNDTHLWGSKVTFGESCTKIEFHRKYLQCPVVQDLAALKEFLRTAPKWLIVRYRNEQSMVLRVKNELICKNYGDWPLMEDMAFDFNISASTLRRKLELEGATFQSVKNEIRCSVAEVALRRNNQSIKEISEGIGFQEVSAFQRAFKKWTGLSPGSYRKQHLNY